MSTKLEAYLEEISHFLSGREEREEILSEIRSHILEKAERELIARALQETKWQKTKAAELLGISRATLYSKVRQHSIENTQDESETPEAVLIN